uniref:C1q domain-containing protein n=1 Tax=Pinctada fucata TaxID=50426 RepID=A0A194AND2_PINFU
MKTDITRSTMSRQVFILFIIFAYSECIEKCQNQDKLIERLDRLESEVHELKQENKLLRYEITTLKSDSHNGDNRTAVRSKDKKRLIGDDTVAFYAVLTSTFDKNIGPHHVFIYDHIESNFGGGYNSNTGIFTAPKFGVFAFLWTIAAEGTTGSGDYGEVETELIVNAKKRGYAFADTEVSWDDDQTTGFVIVQLNQGDVVYVRSTGTPQGNLQVNYNGSWTFSGWQIA